MRKAATLRRGGPPGAGTATTTSWLANERYFTENPEGRQQARQVHALGPKSLAHLLDEIERDPAGIRRHVARYASLDPAFVAAAGGRDWVRPADVIRIVRRRA
jgi:hypothetical protein